jgi:hypothetical protein
LLNKPGWSLILIFVLPSGKFLRVVIDVPAEEYDSGKVVN